MATSGDPSLPPPTPEALQLLLTPTPTDQTGYYQRYVQTWKVLRGPGFPLDEARDLERAAQAPSPAACTQRAWHGKWRPSWRQAAAGRRWPQCAYPPLVIHGEANPLVPVACGIDVADTVPGGRSA